MIYLTSGGPFINLQFTYLIKRFTKHGIKDKYSSLTNILNTSGAFQDKTQMVEDQLQFNT